MKKILDNTNKIKQHISPKLRRRLMIFSLILIVMAGISVYHLIQYYLPIIRTIAGLVLGCLLGIFVGRMFKISWDTEQEKVVGTMDLIGGVILAIYISIEIGRKRIFGHWIQGTELQTFTFLFLTGIFIGRLCANLSLIRQVLRQEDKLPTTS